MSSAADGAPPVAVTADCHPPPENGDASFILFALVQAAEADVRRLTASLQEVDRHLSEAEGGAGPSTRMELRSKRRQLREDLDRARARLDVELDGMRQYALGGDRPERRPLPGKAEAAELFTASLRVLPDYSSRLDQLVRSALALWKERDQPGRIALAGLAREMDGLDDALKRWIHKLSALHEEGRLTDVQRLELRLRLTELELKYHTALDVFAELKKSEPALRRVV